jgi:hypothetical protein
VPEGEFDDLRSDGRGSGVLLERLVHLLLAHELVTAVGADVGALQADQPAQLLEWLGVIVHAQVEDAVGPGPRLASGFRFHDQDRGRLPSADVAAHRLPRVERGQQPIREITSGLLVGGRHCRPHLRVRHEIGLCGVLRADVVSRGGDGLLAGVRGDAALGVDDRDLADVLLRVGGDELRERIGCRDAMPQQLEPALPVAGINERLRGNRAYAGLGPRDDGADREPV